MACLSDGSSVANMWKLTFGIIFVCIYMHYSLDMTSDSDSVAIRAVLQPLLNKYFALLLGIV